MNTQILATYYVIRINTSKEIFQQLRGAIGVQKYHIRVKFNVQNSLMLLLQVTIH